MNGVHEKASWLNEPQSTTIQTLKNSFSRRIVLLDGTYFGDVGENIIHYNLFMHPKIMSPYSGNHFCGIDPGFAHTKCRWRYIVGDNLSRITENIGGKVRGITPIIAENEGWIKMTSYERLFGYLGADDIYMNQVRILLKMHPEIGRNVWMITQEGVGKIGIE